MRPYPYVALTRLAALVLTIVVITVAAIAARPPREMTIETGPIGGSYYTNAQLYQAALKRQGITLHLRVNPNSLEIVRNVGTPGSGADAGFIAQDVSASQDAALFSAGQIEIQPLFVFASAELGRRSTLDDLRGRRIVMPPSGSATSKAAQQLLKLYDITEINSQFTYLPIAEAAKALRARKFDAGAFMLSAENPMIRELASDSGLQLVPVTEAKAISNQLPFLRPVTLPRGIYNIADGIPPTNTPLVAAPVGVVVRQGLHPFLVFSLLQAMTNTHRGPTFISAAGDFPSIEDSQLAVDPRATEYFRTGVPWLYRALPPWTASVFDRYQLWILGALLLGGVYLGVRCVLAVAGVLWAPFAQRRITRAGRTQAAEQTAGD